MITIDYIKKHLRVAQILDLLFVLMNLTDVQVSANIVVQFKNKTFFGSPMYVCQSFLFIAPARRGVDETD